MIDCNTRLRTKQHLADQQGAKQRDDVLLFAQGHAAVDGHPGQQDALKCRFTCAAGQFTEGFEGALNGLLQRFHPRLVGKALVIEGTIEFANACGQVGNVAKAVQ
ncbi:hypothetical protein ALQ39_200008 [Pseudomonas amygdali pv. eriobotryae]|uniref:Uncharacterized protein n=1 Tax=Pseudomonas amygdali pv. eriobotryae TaxID=129137 RepID=A0A3M3ATH6_PSEA0|nr:hypothetical protein ALQ86_200081 [Pseudomonas amygdali pv. eriobotryae]RMO62059.1 hypothetical protein ALQ39_200008 [Pseudomonas amygdali pv. eriobotryae]